MAFALPTLLPSSAWHVAHRHRTTSHWDWDGDWDWDGPPCPHMLLQHTKKERKLLLARACGNVGVDRQRCLQGGQRRGGAGERKGREPSRSLGEWKRRERERGGRERQWESDRGRETAHTHTHTRGRHRDARRRRAERNVSWGASLCLLVASWPHHHIRHITTGWGRLILAREVRMCTALV